MRVHNSESIRSERRSLRMTGRRKKQELKHLLRLCTTNLSRQNRGKGPPQAVRGLIRSSNTCMHYMHQYGGPGKTWTKAQLVNLSTNLNGGAGR